MERTWMDGLFLSLSPSLFLTVKTTNRFSILLLTPLTPLLWAPRTAPGQLFELGGWEGGPTSGTAMHHVQTKKRKKKKMILSSRTTVRSLWSTISTNNMTPPCDHPVIHSALTNKRAAWRETSSGLSGNADLLDINSDASAQPAQLSCVEELMVGRKKNNTKYRSGHVTYLCI